MTLKHCVIAMSVTACATLLGCSQGAAALRAAAKHLSAPQVGTLEVCATGRSYVHTDTGVREIYDVSNFIASADYVEFAGRVQTTRRQHFDPGTLHLFPAEEQSDRFVADGYAWDSSQPASEAAGGVPWTQARPAEMDERLAELWMFPQGFIRAALKHKAQSKTTERGTEVSFSMNGTQYLGSIDEDGDITRVQSWIESDHGLIHLDARYSDYRDYHGVRFPRHIVRTRNGERDLELTVCSLKTGSAFEVFVPRAVQMTAQAEPTEQSSGG